MVIKHGQKGLSREALGERTNEWMHLLYQAFGGPDKPETFSSSLWYELAGKPAEYTEAIAGRTSKLLISLGLLSREQKGHSGKTPQWTWTLLKPEAEAQAIVTKFFAEGGRIATDKEIEYLEARRLRLLGKDPETVQRRNTKTVVARSAARTGDMTDFRQQPSVAPGGPITKISRDDRPPIAIATSPVEEVRAIAGPEPEKPFASLAPLRPETVNAVVEQARIYANRHKSIENSINTMAAMASNLGVKFDRVAAEAAFEVIIDDRMEDIMEVLPYITTLEMRVDRLTTENTELREIKRNYGALVNENQRLKARIQTIVSERVAASQPVVARD